MSNSAPLEGKTIVITRSEEQSHESAALWKNAGADVILFPVIEIKEPADWSEFDTLIINEKFDILIFTSANAVRMFCKRVGELKSEYNFDGVMVVAVGNKTEVACKAENIPVSLVPREFSGAGVVDELCSLNIKGKKVFIPRSALAKDDIVAGLINAGASVDTAVVYDVGIPEKKKAEEAVALINNCNVDFIIFTSPSTYKNFVKLADINDEPEYFSKTNIAAIGKTTKAAIEERGVKVAVIPSIQTMEGLKDAVIEYYKN